MKTITAFVGSARRKGFTTAVVCRFLNDLQSFGDIRVEIVYLSDHNVRLCRGCKTCFLRGEESCPLKDDRDQLIAKMMASDGVVFASPNYSFQVSAIMKAFLDRLGFVLHRPCFHGKTFTSIVVQGIHGGSKIVKYLDFVGNGLGFNVVKGSCTTALEPMSPKDQRKMEQTIARHARRFHDQLLKPAYSSPSIFQLMIFRMARTSIRQMLGDDNQDHNYYRDRGWFESGYYYPIRLGLLKSALGSAFDWMACRIFKQPRQKTA